jgi:hypothetical protein
MVLELYRLSDVVLISVSLRHLELSHLERPRGNGLELGSQAGWSLNTMLYTRLLVLTCQTERALGVDL